MCLTSVVHLENYFLWDWGQQKFRENMKYIKQQGQHDVLIYWQKSFFSWDCSRLLIWNILLSKKSKQILIANCTTDKLLLTILIENSVGKSFLYFSKRSTQSST